MILDKNLNT